MAAALVVGSDHRRSDRKRLAGPTGFGGPTGNATGPTASSNWAVRLVFLGTGPTGVEKPVRPVLRAAPRTVGRKDEFLRFPLIPPIEMHKNHKGSRSAHMQHIYWITISKTHQDFQIGLGFCKLGKNSRTQER